METQNGNRFMIKLAVVILNWNGIGFLKRFLPSVIENSTEDHIEIWIADNGSTDGSIPFIKESFPLVRLLEFDRNHGFAGGYNKALSMINAEYFILLNSDAYVTAGWTEPLLGLMEGNGLVAACMPKIKDASRKEYFEYAGASGGYIDFLGYPFCRGRLFDVIEQDNGQYDDEREIFWATGACMMVRASDWHGSGGLDETFFAHMEEIDMCWRMKNQGKKIMICPSSTIYHLGGGSLPSLHPRKTFLNFRNSLLMLLKNLPPGKLHILLPRFIFDWLSIFKFLFSLSFSNAFAVIRAHLSFFRYFPAYLKKRKQLQQSISVIIDHKEIYKGSIVIDFFLRKRKLFSQIEDTT
jgi:GT2 family glycosyltransferase